MILGGFFGGLEKLLVGMSRAMRQEISRKDARMCLPEFMERYFADYGVVGKLALGFVCS